MRLHMPTQTAAAGESFSTLLTCDGLGMFLLIGSRFLRILHCKIRCLELKRISFVEGLLSALTRIVAMSLPRLFLSLGEKYRVADGMFIIH